MQPSQLSFFTDVFTPFCCRPRRQPSVRSSPPTADELRRTAAHLRALAEYSDFLVCEIDATDMALHAARSPASRPAALSPHAATRLIDPLRHSRASPSPPCAPGALIPLPTAPYLLLASHDAATPPAIHAADARSVLNAHPALPLPPLPPALSTASLPPHASLRAAAATLAALPKPALVVCRDGREASALVALACVLLTERTPLLELLRASVGARPELLRDREAQLRLCALAHEEGLLAAPTAWGVPMPGKTPAAWKQTYRIPRIDEGEGSGEMEGGGEGGLARGPAVEGGLAS